MSFRDRLSRLTQHQAAQLLGEHGNKLIQAGSRKFDPDPEDDAYLGGDLFRVVASRTRACRTAKRWS